MKGCIHIYTGDGKGKTSAAVGLAIRFAGKGGKVLFSQMLKDGTSGEIAVLEGTDGIDVDVCRENFGFSFSMSDETRIRAATAYTAHLENLLKRAGEDGYGMLVLDEIIAAYNLQFIDCGMLIEFLKHKPENLEVVLTGREPAAELVELADYISEIKKVRHPFDNGLTAREGIEY